MSFTYLREGRDGLYQKFLYPENKAGHHCLVIKKFGEKNDDSDICGINAESWNDAF